MAGTIERNVGNLHDQDTGKLVGYRNPVTGLEEPLDAAALQELSGLKNTRSSRVATRLYYCASSSSPSQNTLAAVAGTTWGGQTRITFAMLTTTECDFDAVSVILANGTLGAVTVDAAYAGNPLAAASHQTQMGAERYQLKFGGLNSVTIPAAADQNTPNFVVSDPCALSSRPRTDGGTLPLVAFDVEFTSAGSGTEVISFWGRAGTDWGTTDTGVSGRLTKTGRTLGAASGTAVAVTSNTGNTPIFGLVYWARGVAVRTVFAPGDSIVGGQSLTNRAVSFPVRAARSASTPQKPVEVMVLSIPGGGMSNFLGALRRLMGQSGIPTGACRPTHVLLPHATPNGTTASTLNDTTFNTWRAQISQTVELCREYGIPVTAWTMLPRSTNATTGYYDSTSVTNLRDWEAAYSALDVPLLDAGAAVRDTSAGNRFQTTALGYAADLSTDWLHPNDAGDALIASVAVAPWMARLAP